MDGDDMENIRLWYQNKDDRTMLGYINDGKIGVLEIGYVFHTACIWDRVVIIDRLLQFEITKVYFNSGLCRAIEHNRLSVVNHILKLSELGLSRENWECLREALNQEDKTIAVRLLQDARIPKKEIIQRWRWLFKPLPADEAEWLPVQSYTEDILILLRKSRLRMMVMYSKGFSRISDLPKELVHLISSYTEPYHIEELKQFASFVEKIERCRSF
jgi:hypothetical protein